MFGTITFYTIFVFKMILRWDGKTSYRHVFSHGLNLSRVGDKRNIFLKHYLLGNPNLEVLLIIRLIIFLN